MNVGLKTVFKLMPREVAEMRNQGDRGHYRKVKNTMIEALEMLKDPATIECIKKEYTRARYERLCELVNNPDELRALSEKTYLKDTLDETFPYIHAYHKFHLIMAEKFIFKDGDFPEHAPEREPVEYDLTSLISRDSSCDFSCQIRLP